MARFFLPGQLYYNGLKAMSPGVGRSLPCRKAESELSHHVNCFVRAFCRRAVGRS